jgi:hypothetical protein
MVDNAEAMIHTSFRVVQTLRNTADFALFTDACCASNLAILSKLATMEFPSSQNSEPETAAITPTAIPPAAAINPTTPAATDGTTTRIADGPPSSSFRAHALQHEMAVRGYLASCESLQERIKNLIELVGYTLTLHNQLETGKLDKEVRDMTRTLRDLTQTNVDDSAIVRLITIVSAIYLPGSFIGVCTCKSFPFFFLLLPKALSFFFFPWGFLTFCSVVSPSGLFSESSSWGRVKLTL